MNLTGVADVQYVTIAYSNVNSNDGGTGTVQIGFLTGDVNRSRNVSIADLLFINAQLALPVTALNFLRDVNASGSISVADTLTVNGALTNGLGAPH